MIRERNIEDLIHEANHFARSNAVAFFGISVVAGFALERRAPSHSEHISAAQNAITQFIREQPLIVGAVGLTTGAIIGASLPLAVAVEFDPEEEPERRSTGEILSEASGRIVSMTARSRCSTKRLTRAASKRRNS